MLATGVEGVRGAIAGGGTALYHLPPPLLFIAMLLLAVGDVVMCNHGNGVTNGLQRRSKRSANLVPFPVLDSN